MWCPLGSVPIKDIELDTKSRDDTPAILIGLQAVWRSEETRDKLLRLLNESTPPGVRRDTGREGMDLWAILVLGVLKQGQRCDYDRLHPTSRTKIWTSSASWATSRGWRMARTGARASAIT